LTGAAIGVERPISGLGATPALGAGLNASIAGMVPSSTTSLSSVRESSLIELIF
jgi:hypothetical protein